MGVRGLTTFIANRRRDYYEPYFLYDTYVVLDGHSVSSQLYVWQCKRNDCFGGDYDQFAHVVHNFFQLLSKCNITPLVIFDGGYEKRKLKTVHLRIKSRVQAAKALNTVRHTSVVFPLFVHNVFIDVCERLKVKCLRTEFEGDGEAAYLARSLNCPIISYDSDFYIFDVIYIPFNTLELTAQKLRDSKFYISCDVYKVDKFLKSFGGMDKVNLPLLSMLLGNDYVHRSVFGAFYRQLKMQKCKGSDQQKRIKSVIMWLKDRTPECAISYILSRFKADRRKTIAAKIEDAIESYNISDSRILEYFRISPKIEIQSKPIIVDVNAVDINDEECTSGSESEVSSSPDDDDAGAIEEVEESKYSQLFNNVSRDFRANFQKCLYPASFIDLLTKRTYYSTPQVEDFSEPNHSHTISMEIISTIYRILTLPKKQPLFCIARDENAHVKKFLLPQDLACNLPQLKVIEEENLESRRLMLHQVLDCPQDIYKTFLCKFPPTWHLFLLSMRYWIIKSENYDKAHVYALILCSMIVNFVDKKIGTFCRSEIRLRTFGSGENSEEKRSEMQGHNILNAIKRIGRQESVTCLRTLVHYFEMDPKMRTNGSLFRRDVIHKFAQFQSCALHIKYLNSLLNFPYPKSLIISDFYNGTFLHNMTCNLMKRSNLDEYVKSLLGNCPTILKTLELMMSEICVNVGESLPLSNQNTRKTRKRSKKRKKKVEEIVTEEPTGNIESDPEECDLGDNKFAVLQSCA